MPWNIERHYAFGEGIYRSSSPIDPKFPDGAVFNALNCVYDGDTDNIQSMYGASQLGSSLGDVVSGLFDYKTGTKLVATCEDGKIYQCNTGVWAQATGGTGFSTTSNLRWYGAMFYGATTTDDLLILCNGTDAPQRYDTSNGVAALGGSPPSTGNYPCAWQSRLWMATGSTLYYSAVDDCEDWTTAGGGGTINIARGHDGPIVGLAAFANSLFIFKRSSIYHIGPTQTFSSLNVRNVNRVNGTINGATIQEGEIGDRNVLFWISEHGIEAIGPTGATGGFEPVDISRRVEPIYETRNITAMDTAWSIFNLARKEFYVFFPTGSKTVPSVGLIGNTARPGRPPRWTQMNRNNLTAGVVFNGDASIASSANLNYIQYVGDNGGRIYRMHDTSTQLFAGATVTSQVQTKYYLQGYPEHMKRYAWTFVSADKITTNVVNVNRVLLRQGLPTITAGNSAQFQANGTGIAGWGVGEWGVEPWGGAGVSGERIRLTSGNRGLGLSLIVSTTHWFRLKGVSIASKLLSDKVAA